MNDEYWKRIFEHCVRPRSSEPIAEVCQVCRSLGVDRTATDAIADVLHEKAGKGFPSLGLLELFLSDACNLACPYCFVHAKNKSRLMSLATAQKAFELLLRESGLRKNLGVLFMGGEPLLAMTLISVFVPWANQKAAEVGKSITYNMTSNGTLVTDSIAERLRALKVTVLLSIDGIGAAHDRSRPFKDGTGSFQKVVEGMTILRRHQGFLGTKMTVVPSEASSVFHHVRGLWHLGVSTFIIGPATGVDWSHRALDDYAASLWQAYEWWSDLAPNRRPRLTYVDRALRSPRREERHRWGCRAGRTGIVVSPEGGVFPCSKVLGTNSGKGVLQLGTVTEGLTETETRRRLCGSKPVERPACWNCHLQSSCRGGCYAVNFDATGDPFVPGEECRVGAVLELLQSKIAAAEAQRNRSHRSVKHEAR